MTQLVVSDVSKRYGATVALDRVSLSIEAGSRVAVVGPSGSGKSTFLRCINHLTKITSGYLSVDGELVGYQRRGNALHELSENETAAKRAEIGMVFQRFNLFQHMTALENVIEGPVGVLGENRREATARARELLKRVGLEHKADSFPAELSGGQQQRVAIARALAMRPKLILFDEPTSALDPELVGEVLDVMRTLAHSGMTMVIVTHEIAFARDIADLVVFMDEGQVVESGPPAEVLANPRQERTRKFLLSVRGEDGHAR